MARIDLIQIRRGTASDWSTVNPVLALAEPGYETDTRLMKYGDGVTAWNDLEYSPPPPVIPPPVTPTWRTISTDTVLTPDTNDGGIEVTGEAVITLPVTDAFPDFWETTIWQSAAGLVELRPEDETVTIHTPAGKTTFLTGEQAIVRLLHRAERVWILRGDLADPVPPAEDESIFDFTLDGYTAPVDGATFDFTESGYVAPVSL